MKGRLRALLLVAVAAACSRDTPAPGGGKPPNVLVVLLDTLRPDHLGCYGSPRPTSPHLDALAARSCLFENAQSCAPLTVASLLSLSSSLYPEVHGVQGLQNPGRMSDHVTTLAELFAAHGYATAAFTEGGYANPQFGLGQGFQTFSSFAEDSDPDVSNVLGESRLPQNLKRATNWLRGAASKPFFLFFHTYEVHQPNYARPDYMRLFRPGFDEAADHARAAQAIEAWNTRHEADAAGCQTLLEHLYQCPRTGLPELQDPDGFDKLAAKNHWGPDDVLENQPLLALVRDLYDASIRYTDDQLEQLWQTLDELQLSENTILVVVSDHGEGLGQHHELEHSNVLHEEALHVALWIRAPGQDFAPRRVPTLVRTIDVMPTLLELAGIDARGQAMQGRSLVPLMRGEKEPDRICFSHARRVDAQQNPQFTVRDRQWRLIVEPLARKRWLYDLTKDPGELTDVSASHADVAERLEDLLAQQSKQDLWLREQIGAAPGELVLDEKTMKDLRALGYAGKDTK